MILNSPLDEETEGLATAVIDAAFKVHKALGPGLLESVYQTCLGHELTRRGVPIKTEVPMPVVYEGLKLETGLRLDMMVSDRIVVELKAVDRLLPIHEAQLLTYLKMSGCRLGLLINFNSVLIKDGIRRIIA